MRADLAEWLETHRRQTDEVLWASTAREDDRCIGHAGLYRIDHRVRKAEYAILIGDANYLGKGIGQEVSEAVIRYGFEQLNLHKIFLEVLATNERAVRLYRRLRVVLEGVSRHDQFRDGHYVDVIRMSLLEGEGSEVG